MDSIFLEKIRKQVDDWRIAGYKGIYRETENILTHIKRVGFLHEPQVQALETYIYLKEVMGNKASLEIFRSSFENEKDLVLGLGVPKDQAFDLIGDKDEIERRLIDAFGELDYANQVYALTMGSGKTILMAVMMLYDFTLSFYHKDDMRFAKNALVFAPDTTIIESLKEIKTFDYAKVLPKEYQNIILNIKYHYLESPETALAPIGNYNVIVSNSQKIILKTRNSESKNGALRLFGDKKQNEKREIENARLRAIRQLSQLTIFVDEAHHSYGKTLEGTLKKTRQTIDYLHKSTPLVSVVNLTGTPYVNNKMIADVVFHFGLKQGIEKGILKQMRIVGFGNVRSQKFLEEVIDTFVAEYGKKRLEGRLPKIAFYAANIDDLRKDLRPKLERILATRGISLDAVLEYHTKAEENADEFRRLDTADSRKQIVLLVGKGTEGWNCRSLVAVALYKKPKSTILVLQSTTRCLRRIGDNQTKAHVFLSDENYRILDHELKSNFNTSVNELNAQDQRMVPHTLNIQKRKTVMVKKITHEIVAVQASDVKSIKIDFDKFNPEKYQAYVGEGGIFIGNEGKAHYEQVQATRKIQEKGDFTFYEIAEIINRSTHLPCIVVDQIIAESGKTRSDFVAMVNDSPALVPFVVGEILKRAYRYEEKSDTMEEELELTKIESFPFEINIQQNRESLVVYKANEEEAGHAGRIGFHINPYNFDSGDEKDLFRWLRSVLEKDEALADVYFTGARVCADPTHTDFYFEYWSPEQQRMARYFPDFLVETSKGRFLVVETKDGSEKADYEANKRSYDGTMGNLTNEILAKELGFQEFQAINKNFEYKIMFNASLQQEQVKLFETMKSLS
ncbi:MAG: DEAD/DEAH box helicase family protein [Patescibacteria group bacterium]